MEYAGISIYSSPHCKHSKRSLVVIYHLLIAIINNIIMCNENLLANMNIKEKRFLLHCTPYYYEHIIMNKLM